MQLEYKIPLIILLCIIGFYFSTNLFSLKVKPDEDIIFYPTTACFNPADGLWHVDIHAQVLETEDDSVIRNAFISYLKSSLDIEKPEESSVLKSRLRYFLADNQRWKSISIQIGTKSYILKNTKANGHVRETLTFKDKEFRAIAGDNFQKSIIPFRARLPKKDPRDFEGTIHILKENSIILISDIDDTIKISDVHNKKALLRNTFLEEFKPVPGMASFYTGLHAKGANVCYVSASPWQLYTDLNAFVKKEGFPDGTFAMKFFRVKDTDFFNLLESPDAYKIETISDIIKKSPGARFILVGDNGEKDPEAYGELARRYPDKIMKILIREAYPEKDGKRYAEAFKSLKRGQWEAFAVPESITFRLP